MLLKSVQMLLLKMSIHFSSVIVEVVVGNPCRHKIIMKSKHIDTPCQGWSCWSVTRPCIGSWAMCVLLLVRRPASVTPLGTCLAVLVLGVRSSLHSCLSFTPSHRYCITILLPNQPYLPLPCIVNISLTHHPHLTNTMVLLFFLPPMQTHTYLLVTHLCTFHISFIHQPLSYIVVLLFCSTSGFLFTTLFCMALLIYLFPKQT